MAALARFVNCIQTDGEELAPEWTSWTSAGEASSRQNGGRRPVATDSLS
jgi:hypothetical protein